MKTGFLSNFMKTEKSKYKVIGTAITVVIVALVIILNSIISVIASKNSWYIDMTGQHIYSLSNELTSYLDSAELNGQVEIIFPVSQDKVEMDFSDTEKGPKAYVHSTAKLLSERYDNISISYHDIIKEKSFYDTNFTRGQTLPSENRVIIARKNTNSGDAYSSYVIKDYSYFFGSDESGNLISYNGEAVFASAVTSLSFNKTPTVYFTVGHNESSFSNIVYGEGGSIVSYDLSDSKGVEGEKFLNLFKDFGFDLKPIDLKLSSVPDEASMLIINQPTVDFSLEETIRIQDYLKNVGSVMCFADWDANLPVLYDFAKTWGGITVKNDRIEDPTQCSVSDAFSFYGTAPSNDAVNSYFSEIADKAIKAKLTNSGYIEIDPDYASEDGHTTSGVGTVNTASILNTSGNAEANGQKGTYSVMTVSAAALTREETQKYSYLIMCPSADFISNDNISSSYANMKIILSLVHSTTPVQVAVDVGYKMFNNYTLDIPKKTANTLTVVLTLAMPLLITACGAVVLIRRKNK